LKYLQEASGITEIVCIERNRHFLDDLKEMEARKSTSAKIGIFSGSLPDYLTANPRLVGSFDAVICIHSICSMGRARPVAKLIQMALKKGGKLIFMENVVAKPHRERLRTFQRLCKVPWLVFGGWDICKDTGSALKDVGWKSIKMEYFEAKELRYLAISPHISGVAVAAESKGGLHKDADVTYRNAMNRLSRRT